jgi:hypothetical protein
VSKAGDPNKSKSDNRKLKQRPFECTDFQWEGLLEAAQKEGISRPEYMRRKLFGSPSEDRLKALLTQVLENQIPLDEFRQVLQSVVLSEKLVEKAYGNSEETKSVYDQTKKEVKKQLAFPKFPEGR